MVVIIIGAAVLFIEIIILMIMNKKNKDYLEYRRAGESIADNKLLEQQLKNPYKPDAEINNNPICPYFICLSQVNSKQKAKYVFGLDDNLTIGRARNNNMLVLSDGAVSEYHCVIFFFQGNVILRDLNSANGVVISKGFAKKMLVSNGGSARLDNGCRILIGNMEFAVRIFMI